MPPDTAPVWRTALNLEYFTVIYTVFEAAASIAFGAAAGSIALVGFGFDSVVESPSGLVQIWRLRRHGRGLARRGGTHRTAGPGDSSRSRSSCSGRTCSSNLSGN